MCEKSKENCLNRSKRLLNKLKNALEADVICFFSDKKNFAQDQKLNRRNDRWLCSDPFEMPRVICTKFPSIVMVLDVVSNEGHVIPPHFFPQGLRVNAAAYIEVLETVVKPWIDNICNIRPYIFQQELAPSHKALQTQKWMANHLYDHITPNIWPPNSPSTRLLCVERCCEGG